ncbi:MFS transporter [Pigmentiphaga soli]|uniref:MFS transporter n=2 Tax=Pigmentiphaga soli TaxID=1007095 RepID=A0ABP8GLE7_9BURK
MVSAVAVALPPIGADLHAGANTLSLVETLYLAGNVAVLLPAGRLADAGSKASLYKFGLLGFALLTLLVSFSTSVPVLLSLRFMQGAAAAFVAVAGPALIVGAVAPERRGRALGTVVGAIYAGLTLGPVCAGFLIDAFGWRAVFVADAAVVLAAYGLARIVLPRGWRAPGARAVHLPSCALVVAATLLLTLGPSNLRTPALGYALIAAGLATAFVFVLLQRRLAQPLLDVGLLASNAQLRRALLVQWLLYCNAFSSSFMLAIYMQVTLGNAAKVSGQVLALGSVLMAAVAPFAGALADRYPPRAVAACGVGVVLVSALLAISFDADSSLVAVGVMLAVQGLGFALFSSPNMTMIMGSVPRDRASTASSFAAKARMLGMLSGMIITAIAISLGIGSAPVSADPLAFLPVMTAVFVALALLSLAALAISLSARRA